MKKFLVPSWPPLILCGVRISPHTCESEDGSAVGSLHFRRSAEDDWRVRRLQGLLQRLANAPATEAQPDSCLSAGHCLIFLLSKGGGLALSCRGKAEWEELKANSYASGVLGGTSDQWKAELTAQWTACKGAKEQNSALCRRYGRLGASMGVSPNLEEPVFLSILTVKKRKFAPCWERHHPVAKQSSGSGCWSGNWRPRRRAGPPPPPVPAERCAQPTHYLT